MSTDAGPPAHGRFHHEEPVSRPGSHRSTAHGIDHVGERAIRTLFLPNGPGLELFEFDGPDQHAVATPADLGRQHIALDVDDLDAALGGDEAGDGNRFVHLRAPWGSTIELISHPSRQPYLDDAEHGKWHV
jgi:catechol 2,3-dioxygenase-like lactoylglutathione lyase family enzyme